MHHEDRNALQRSGRKRKDFTTKQLVYVFISVLLAVMVGGAAWLGQQWKIEQLNDRVTYWQQMAQSGARFAAENAAQQAHACGRTSNGGVNSVVIKSIDKSTRQITFSNPHSTEGGNVGYYCKDPIVDDDSGHALSIDDLKIGQRINTLQDNDYILKIEVLL